MAIRKVNFKSSKFKNVDNNNKYNTFFFVVSGYRRSTHLAVFENMYGKM